MSCYLCCSGSQRPCWAHSPTHPRSPTHCPPAAGAPAAAFAAHTSGAARAPHLPVLPLAAPRCVPHTPCRPPLRRAAEAGRGLQRSPGPRPLLKQGTQSRLPSTASPGLPRGAQPGEGMNHHWQHLLSCFGLLCGNQRNYQYQFASGWFCGKAFMTRINIF